MTVGFAVVYRWKLKPGHEAAFEEAWRSMTLVLRRDRGALGSRLHRADDGTWVAYAQWPSEEAWRESSAMDSADPGAAAIMAEAVLERFPPMLLHPVADLLDRVPAPE